MQWFRHQNDEYGWNGDDDVSYDTSSNRGEVCINFDDGEEVRTDRQKKDELLGVLYDHLDDIIALQDECDQECAHYELENIVDGDFILDGNENGTLMFFIRKENN